MTAFDIIITPDAETDLFDLRDYIAYNLHSPETALSYVRYMRSAIAKLSYMASTIAPISDEPWHSRGVRKLIVKNHYIYYRIDFDSHRVYILSVIYSKRDQLKALRENIWV